MVEVLVSNSLIDRCRDYGEAVVANYLAGKNERSRLCGFNKRNIFDNPHEQFVGKLCEVAAAVAFDVDPNDDLKWGIIYLTPSPFLTRFCP